MKLSFSLGNKAKTATAAPLGNAPALKKPAAFGSLDDDDDNNNNAVPSSSKAKKREARPVTTTASSWRAGPKKGFAAPPDPTVSQYDEVYDEMKGAQERARAGKEEESKDKKPKYMEKLLISAETRKLDYVRAEEKLIQREREQEGDEFLEKDKFVTPAYKAQMEEVRKAEAEEKKREEAEAKKRKTNPGLAAFYRDYLQKSSEERSAAVAATQAASEQSALPEVQQQSLRIVRPLKIAPDPDSVLKSAEDDPDKLSNEEKIRKAQEEGREVELDDDGQLVDKRDILAAGLNLSAPNTRKLGPGLKAFKKAGDAEGEPVHRAAGSAASRAEIRARQQKELERQYQEEQERLAVQKVKDEEEERQRQTKRKNNDEEVMSARERYLERKRRKMEEEQQQAGVT